MAHRRTRNSKRIPLIERICLLKDAYSPEFHESQRHYVPYPIEPGPQPCVTASIGKDGTENLADSIVILPKDAPHCDPVSIPLYQSSLGLIKCTHARLIKGLNGQIAKLDSIVIRNLIRVWTQSDWRNPPFRSASRGWTPIHLAVRAVEQRRQKHWWILSHWRKWEDDGLQPYYRLVAYQQRFPHSGRPPQQPDHKTFRQVMGAFEKVYQEYLRLECNTRNNTREMKRLRREWQAARDARAGLV